MYLKALTTPSVQVSKRERTAVKNMSQLEHIEAIEKRLWSAADNLRANFTIVHYIPVESYLFPFFQEGVAQTQVTNLAGGAAQPNISGGQIESIQLLIPGKKIFDLYLETTKAAFR